MQINIERLMADLERYAQYGMNEEGGITRPSFSAADQTVRRLFISEMIEMGLDVFVDPAANIWAKRRGSGRKTGSIVIGSHLDTVPNGGKYDGALGVLMAKEIVCTLMENNVGTDHDLEIVSFTAEESNDYNLSTMGSRAFAGRLSKEQMLEASDLNGVMLKDAIVQVGGDLERYGEFKKLRSEKKAFVELHIEQGKRLESKGIAVAVVDRVVGIYRTHVTVVGEANHSGTTMMDHRVDALAAASEMVLVVEDVCRSVPSDLVGTVGKLNVKPNATNTIAGQVDFILEIRGGDKEGIRQALSSIQQEWKKIAELRGVTIEERLILNQDPEMLDAQLVDILAGTAKRLNEPYMHLSSMAVHDAVHVAAVTRSCMIFVRSINGKSHSPEEYSTPEDIEKVGNVMLSSILEIDRWLAAGRDEAVAPTADAG
ncbi:Zn-dependent hydrolase [Paenibacillus hamazuiensis]|uniref:Zn-dependent hydrolase n=1 Tax=Paenibacillus hamazuiensis TaxID=2936508 RepID=UPI00200CAEFC|nr:Zn-dependent hydrolase [Paenibacillus hamazuiensis]